MNFVVMLGRLTKDPELFYGKDSGKPICKFHIAVDANYTKGDKKAYFFECRAVGKTGEVIANYLQKGRKILLTGHLEQDAYTDKDGKKCEKYCVFCSSFEFCDTKSDATGNVDKPTDEFMKVPDNVADGLPFM